jgi:hypothetical protein
VVNFDISITILVNNGSLPPEEVIKVTIWGRRKLKKKAINAAQHLVQAAAGLPGGDHVGQQFGNEGASVTPSAASTKSTVHTFVNKNI